MLEERDHALARGAPVVSVRSATNFMHITMLTCHRCHQLAEVAGCGASCDAEHITAPARDGRGATAAMCAALRQAGMRAEDVDYVSAHATSTPVGDRLEVCWL